MIKNSLLILALTSLLLLDSAFVNIYDTKKQPTDKRIPPPFENVSSAWVDSVFASLTPDERIGQLFMIRAHSNKGQEHIDEVINLITNQKVGGVIFFQGGPVRQAVLTNKYQLLAKTPLLVAMDAEWGVSMRLDSTVKYPYQNRLGGIKDNRLLYEMGAEIARQCRRLGVHVNFAPVIDVNNNPKNPVIGFRSFGEDPINVAKKGYAYMSGMQDNHVLATAKHFPGHGDTDSDSHKTLPVIPHDKARLDSIELLPFKELINTGLGAIMTAHLHIPQLDSTPNLASSLSKPIVTDLLKTELGFKGLVFTDGLGMRGVTNYYSHPDIAVKALVAGNDVLILSQDVEGSIAAIKQAISDSILTWDDINQKCKKILKVKKWAGLDNWKPIKTDSLYQDLNSNAAKAIKRKLIKASSSLLRNRNQIIPFQAIDTLYLASLSLGTDKLTTFHQTIDLYTQIEHYAINNATENIFDALITPLSKYDAVIISIHDLNNWQSKKYGLKTEAVHFIEKLSKLTNVVLNLFGNPYCLQYFDDDRNIDAILLSYDDSNEAQDIAAQVLFGGKPAQGKLAVHVSNEFPRNFGLTTQKIRLGYSLPDEENMDSQVLTRIDSLVNDAIDRRATPGCQILAAKDGEIIFYKSYGYHTYKKKQAVKNSDIYDLASVTKIMATLPALMRLYDEGKFDIKKKLSDYLTFLDSTNKQNLRISDVLTHQARLEPWIPFYLLSMKKTDAEQYCLDDSLYSPVYTTQHTLQVADKLYIKPQYRDSIFKTIVASKLRRRKRYRYSDLGFYLFQRVIEDLTDTALNEYVDNNFYRILGANTLCYNPLMQFDKERIVPTSIDHIFRKQLLHGYVHDEGAAMLGGVAGHAGLFANANDLAKMMQMYLQMGEYGGKRYINESTMKLFTSCPYCHYRRRRKNRRGYGFDKPFINSVGQPSYKWMSASSFGHTGFTGTYVWADPETQIVYIFLSNRVYPDSENKELIECGVRRKVQKVFYDALKPGKQPPLHKDLQTTDTHDATLRNKRIASHVGGKSSL